MTGSLAAQLAKHQFGAERVVVAGRNAERLRGISSNSVSTRQSAAMLRSAGIELVGQGAGSVPREAFDRIISEILPALFTMLSKGTISIETVAHPLTEVSEVWTETTASNVRAVLTP